MVTRPDKAYMVRAQAQVAEIDAGLRAFMQRVYAYMSGGLAVTGLVAYFVGTNPTFFGAVYGTPLAWVVMLAPLGFILALNFGINRMSAAMAQFLFWSFAAVMGLSLSYIFVVYTHASITRVFFISAAAFLGLSLYGYTTKRDLSAMGTFLIMGVIGLIVASLVNLFFASGALSFAISVVGVLIFAGLTAYDTQKIKEFYWEADGHEIAAKKSIVGAVTLYLDFINLFLYMLRFFGDRR